MVLGHRVHGNGPEKAFLYNDWLADSTSWDPTLQYLDTETFTYVLTDLRGYGQSMDQTGEYNENEASADTLALADHLGFDRFHLVGYSMTGMVVERLAIDAPDRIKSIVAIGPVSAAGVKLNDEGRQFFIDVITEDDKTRELADRITGNQLSRKWQDVKLQLARETRTPEAARGYLDMWTLHDFSDEAGENDIPFLIIGCNHDQPNFLEDDMRSTFLKWHKNIELVMMDCGHCPMQEMPIRLQTLMENFMNKHAG
jgi:pimeloyl-ACP methyl ester carboxylesterase